MSYRGHDIKQWDHFKTPRTCPDFYVDRHAGDRVVLIVTCVIGWLLLVGIVGGFV